MLKYLSKVNIFSIVCFVILLFVVYLIVNAIFINITGKGVFESSDPIPKSGPTPPPVTAPIHAPISNKIVSDIQNYFNNAPIISAGTTATPSIILSLSSGPYKRVAFESTPEYTQYVPGVYLSNSSNNFVVNVGLGVNFGSILFSKPNIVVLNSPLCNTGGGIIFGKGTFSLEFSTSANISSTSLQLFYGAGQEPVGGPRFSTESPFKSYSIPSFSIPISFTFSFDYDLSAFIDNTTGIIKNLPPACLMDPAGPFYISPTIAYIYTSTNVTQPISNISFTFNDKNVYCDLASSVYYLNILMSQVLFGSKSIACGKTNPFIDPTLYTGITLNTSNCSLQNVLSQYANSIDIVGDISSALQGSGILSNAVRDVNTLINIYNNDILRANAMISVKPTLTTIPTLPVNYLPCSIYDTIQNSSLQVVPSLTSFLIQTIQTQVTNVHFLNILSKIELSVPIYDIIPYVPQTSVSSTLKGISDIDFGHLSSWVSKTVYNKILQAEAAIKNLGWGQIKTYIKNNLTQIVLDILNFINIDDTSDTGIMMKISTLIYNYINITNDGYTSLTKILVSCMTGCVPKSDLIDNVIIFSDSVGLDISIRQTSSTSYESEKNYKSFNDGTSSWSIGTRFGGSGSFVPNVMGGSSFLSNSYTIPSIIPCNSQWNFSYNVSGSIGIPVGIAGTLFNRCYPTLMFNFKSPIIISPSSGLTPYDICVSLNIGKFSILCTINIGTIDSQGNVTTNYIPITSSNPPTSLGFAINDNLILKDSQTTSSSKILSSIVETLSSMKSSITQANQSGKEPPPLDIGVAASVGKSLPISGPRPSRCS